MVSRNDRIDVTDVLQTAEAMVNLGLGSDPRLANLLEMTRGSADSDGRWTWEDSYSGKTGVDFGPRRQTKKWVTSRSAAVVKKAGLVQP